MYQTLTLGFGLMAPQTWMVPRQKYDVIHYIREAFLKPHNPTQYVAVDRGYLARLPEGDEPRPGAGRRSSRGSAMDYGPSLMATFEVGDDGDELRLQGDRRPARRRAGGRLARPALGRLRPRHAAPRRGLERRGVHRLERHQLQRPAPGPPPPRRPRRSSPTPSAPAGPNPETGRFDDPRLRGRDGRPTARCRAPGPTTRGSTTTATRCPLLHRRQGRRPGDARPTRPTPRPGHADLHPHLEYRPVAARPARCASPRGPWPSPWSVGGRAEPVDAGRLPRRCRFPPPRRRSRCKLLIVRRRPRTTLNGVRRRLTPPPRAP